MDNQSASTTTIRRGSVPPVSYHDIPPQIVIDVGSFSIETDQPVTNVPLPPTVEKATYKVRGKHVRMASIKITRTDDGAIIYQNFDADGIEVVFTAHTAMDDKQITIKPGKDNSRYPIDTIEFDSSAAGRLHVIKIDSEEAINRREHRLSNNDFKIKNVTVRKKVGDVCVTLFSHDTPVAPAPASQEPSIHPEYNDRRYRVFILVEVKEPQPHK
jgi:hypothetical protein